MTEKPVGEGFTGETGIQTGIQGIIETIKKIQPKNNNAETIKAQEERAKKELEDARAREDQIRRETQEREDTAYQRAVEDMKKAGINPASGGQGIAAASGGGITTAAQTDKKLEAIVMQLLQQMDENAKDRLLTASEGDKDRATKIFGTIINTI